MGKVTEKRTCKPGYKQSWETNPVFRDWIQGAPDQPDKAFCKYCKQFLYAHRYSVLKHACTIKHQLNIDKHKKNFENAKQPTTTIDNSTTNIDPAMIEENVHQDVIILEETVETCDTNVIVEEENHETVFEGAIDDLKVHDRDPVQQENEGSEKFLGYSETHEIFEETQEYDDENKDISESNDCSYQDYQHEGEIQEINEESSEEETCNMTNQKVTISTHILDTSRGQPASDVPITLFKLNGNEWKQISQSTTNIDGRCPELITPEDFGTGCYKLHFDVFMYFKQTATKFLYPFIEIVFDCEEGQHYHIPLLLNPFGYSTYRGS